MVWQQTPYLHREGLNKNKKNNGIFYYLFVRWPLQRAFKVCVTPQSRIQAGKPKNKEEKKVCLKFIIRQNQVFLAHYFLNPSLMELAEKQLVFLFYLSLCLSVLPSSVSLFVSVFVFLCLCLFLCVCIFASVYTLDSVRLLVSVLYACEVYV